jgi:hypothetical protein
MKKIQRIALLSVISFSSINTQAHDLERDLGESASATDVYIIDCDIENTHVTFDMITTLPKGSPSDLIVSAELIGGGNTVTLSSPNNIRAESADIQSVKMTVLVHKNKMGKANYRMDYHCMTPAGTHDPAGTFIKNPQDQ